MNLTPEQIEALKALGAIVAMLGTFAVVGAVTDRLAD